VDVRPGDDERPGESRDGYGENGEPSAAHDAHVILSIADFRVQISD
jgi:hypothetical protein